MRIEKSNKSPEMYSRDLQDKAIRVFKTSNSLSCQRRGSNLVYKKGFLKGDSFFVAEVRDLQSKFSVRVFNVHTLQKQERSFSRKRAILKMGPNRDYDKLIGN